MTVPNMHLTAGRPCRVLNKHRDVIPADAIYIGRGHGSRAGNPFVIGPDGDRDQVCDRFRAEVLPTLDVEYMRGHDLVCFCAPRRCHGDDILRKLEATGS